MTLEEAVNLNGSQCTLKRLAVEFRLLNFANGLFPLDAHLCAAEVTATAAAGDHIGDTSTLLGEGLRVNGGAEEHFTELDHLQQTDSHDGGLGIVTPTHAVNPAGSEGNDVLESTTQRYTCHIAHYTDVEVGAVEEGLPNSVINRGIDSWQCLQLHGREVTSGILVLEFDQLLGRRAGRGSLGVKRRGVISNSGLAPLLLGDFVGNIGTRERTAVDAECPANGLGE